MKDLRYVPASKRKSPGCERGRKENPSVWVTGPDPIRRDKYYAWLKHKAQAKFRGEPHTLTWEEFEDLWMDNDDWFRRGRQSDSLCMSMKNWKLGWTVDNIEVIERFNQLRKPKHCDQ